MLQHGTVHASLYNAFSFGLFACELASEDYELVQKLISEWRSQHRRPNDDRLRSCPALVWKIARRSPASLLAGHCFGGSRGHAAAAGDGEGPAHNISKNRRGVSR
jgi:hypothetical protein